MKLTALSQPPFLSSVVWVSLFGPDDLHYHLGDVAMTWLSWHSGAATVMEKRSTKWRVMYCCLIVQMFQRVATISFSVKQDATASHNVKSVMETLTVLMAVTKLTAVRI